MLMNIGRGLMVILWIVIISSPWSPLAPVYPLILAAGALVLILHCLQMLLMRYTLRANGLWKSGDGYQLVLFGVFGLLVLRQRMTQHEKL
ncbi:MAG: hypothetical protein CENE_01129 [Candidatus Celerinatantimonas neptuna]|nr:MAG: hypothetical protein CENE_01129 [Candidatus Celerinatantimonas neptuna]